MKPNIAIYGRTGSGKTTIAQYLSTKYGHTHCMTGLACRQISQILYGSESKQILNDIGDALKVLDENIWLRAALNNSISENPIVLDSMRFQSDYAYLKAGGFSLWQVRTSLDVRISRLNFRGQEYIPSADELHRGEYELENYSFDFIIDNDADISALYQKIDECILVM